MFGNKENHKNIDVVFIEDSGSIRNDLGIRPSGRNEGSMVVMDKSSKSPLFNVGGKFVNDNNKVRGNGAANEETHEGPANNDIIVERFGEERQYHMRRRMMQKPHFAPTQ